MAQAEEKPTSPDVSRKRLPAEIAPLVAAGNAGPSSADGGGGGTNMVKKAQKTTRHRRRVSKSKQEPVEPNAVERVAGNLKSAALAQAHSLIEKIKRASGIELGSAQQAAIEKVLTDFCKFCYEHEKELLERVLTIEKNTTSYLGVFEKNITGDLGVFKKNITSDLEKLRKRAIEAGGKRSAEVVAEYFAEHTARRMQPAAKQKKAERRARNLEIMRGLLTRYKTKAER
jgi:hypothetical protein